MVAYCEQEGIHFQAYSSLGVRNTDTNLLFTNAAVHRIAVKHGVTVAQVLLRYSVQRGISVLPKATHEDHIAQNIDLFAFCLDTEDVGELDALNSGTRFASRNPDIVV
jgi:diketogulonate reductase-like aldo/keto reductase